MTPLMGGTFCLEHYVITVIILIIIEKIILSLSLSLKRTLPVYYKVEHFSEVLCSRGSLTCCMWSKWCSNTKTLHSISCPTDYCSEYINVGAITTLMQCLFIDKSSICMMKKVISVCFAFVTFSISLFWVLRADNRFRVICFGLLFFWRI